MKEMRKIAAVLILSGLGLAGGVSFAAEFEVLDRFSVNGYAVLRGSADIPGGSFSVGVSTFVVKDGNIGIGTTAPSERLEVNGAVKGAYFNSNGFLFRGLISNSPYVNSSWLQAPAGSGIFLVNNGITNWAGIKADGTFEVNGPALFNGGNVGVGTTSPDIYNFGGKILSVQGGASYTNLILAGDINSGIAFGTSTVRLGQITMDSATGLTLYSQGTGTGATMTLARSGSVGIGTMSPAAQLHLANSIAAPGSGEAAGSGQLRLENGSTVLSEAGGLEFKIAGDSNGYGSKIQALNASGSQLVFAGRQANAAWSEYMRINRSGNVGIGTTAPNTNLHIKSANNNDFGQLEIESTGNDARLSLYNSDGAKTTGRGDILMSKSTGYEGMRFMINGVDKMILDENGNVGIGTANPVTNLDVGGTGSIKIPVGTTAERPSTPANGMMRMNTTTGKLEYYYNFGWNSIGAVAASGGTVNDGVSGYRIHTFTTSGEIVFTTGGNIEVLVVAGGGGASRGGGGGGQVYYSGSYAITSQSYTVTVGNGGTGGAMGGQGGQGQSSVFGSITAAGGGGGGAHSGAGGSGACGGGSGSDNTSGAGTGTVHFGGGNSSRSGYGAAGGGGGAGAAGGNGTEESSSLGRGGVGGIGLANAISGSSVYYGGGGGGGANTNSVSVTGGGEGGQGGGGAGSRATDGTGSAATANTGGGGGGSEVEGPTGGAGGSGIVIIRYPN